MVHVEIKGIDVDFPFQPYKCQIDYMEKVITCLQEQKNGVLESPTGTGKTLCLLCAALAWRETFVAHAQLTQGVMKATSEEFHKNLEETLSSAAGTGATGVKKFVPKIIYASRTHSQLSQAVNELKNTVYRPKVCVLGSRDQMCINQDVLKLESSTAKVYACKGKITSRSCVFYNNLDSQRDNKEFSENILDIEDLSKMGDKHKVCPYFMSRELKSNADLIFMPYNYVLDFKSRQANSIDLNGTIILLDEAHNVEQICEETASFDLTSGDLASCMEDCDECFRILTENAASIGEEEAPVAGDMTPEDSGRLKMIFKNIENMIDGVTLKDKKFQEEGSFLYSALEKQNINASTVMQIIDAIDKCNALLASSNTSKVHKGKHLAMQKMADILRILFCRTGEPSGMNLETSRFYKVYIHEEEVKPYQKSQVDIWSKKKESGRTLSYWCFNPGLSMKELVRHGIRSLILTSGTLSPLDSFTSELDVPFPVQLQNPHVITNKQIWAGIITRGPDGEELNSSYHTRFTDKYLNSLGNLLANVSRTTPHGVLVFFPSYPVMDKSVEFWKKNGALKRMEQHKAYFSEPRNKKMLNGIMEQFYEKVNDPAIKGAIFFAVCRGKVSEGLDFANENGRVVVVTGLPFPPRMDPRVGMKMQYLDNLKQRSALKGRDWYRQQASRAVNQAIGRVIRHNQDYGAILLCDMRFSYIEAKEQLPIWIKPHVKTYHEFGIAQRNVVQFFRLAENFISPSTRKNANQGKENELKEDALSDSASNVGDDQKKSYPLVKIHKRPVVRSAPVDSNFNSNASNSLAILRGEEKPVGKESFFFSLKDLRKSKEDLSNAPSTSTVSQAIFKETGNVNSADESSRAKSKKMKMVMKKPDEVPKLSECVDDAKAEEKSKTKETSVAKQFLGGAKKCLSPDEYKKFGKILIAYSKSNDVGKLVDNLMKFFKSNLDKLHLFEGVREFVKGDDKKVVGDAYKRFKAELKATDENGPAGKADLNDAARTESKAAANKTDSTKGNGDGTYLQGAVKRDSFTGGATTKEVAFYAAAPEPKRQKLNSTEQPDGNQQKANPYSDFFPVLSDEESDPDDNEKAVRELLHPTCVVCKKAANGKGPYQAPCGHVACYSCWFSHLKIVKACPKCKEKIRCKNLKKMFFY